MPSRSSTPRLRPCIAELLRTCVHSNSLPLRLEKVAIQTLNHSTNKEENCDGPSASKKEEELQSEFYRLWLSDGELMIQAVLERRLHHTFFTDGPAVGSLLDIKRFRVRRGKRIHGPGEVIYLAIADYEIVPGADPATSTETYDLANEGGFIREESQSLNKNIRPGLQLPQSLPHPPSPETMLFAPSSQDSDDFETADVELKVLDRRRQTLHELSSNTRPSAPWNSPRDQSPRKRRKLLQEKQPTGISPRRNTCVGSADVDGAKVANSTPSSSTSLQQAGPDRPLTTQKQSRPVQPFSITDNRIPTAPATPSPPPLHTLSSLLHPQTHSPLPSRNYTCTVFAIVSWCSPNLTFPRHAQSPFPPKRHVKIHDPSIASRYAGITLAVYDGARTFKPRVGTVALFVGVVMQRWEGEVILNAYAKRGNREDDGGGGSECGERGWYVDDEERLVGMGHNVIGMRDWWAERSQGKGQKAKKG